MPFFTTKASDISIRRSLIEAHEDILYFNSKPGKSNCLRLEKDMEHKYENSVIYLVDDDSAVRDSLRALLKSTGLTISTFESAETFLNSYCPNRPGCLILDVRMPGMDGLELQQELVKRNILIPIIFISGNAGIPESAKAFRSGAVDFLEKPFDSNLIIERIHESLAKAIEENRQHLEKSKVQNRFASLSAREKEVMQIIISTHANKKAAKILGISPRTIEAHRKRIMEKMQAANMTELVAMTLSNSLFPTSCKG